MFRKIIAIFLSVSLLFSQACLAAGTAQLNLSAYFNPAGGMVEADKFRPPHLRYFSYEPDADNYKLLLDKGDLKDMQGKELENQIRPLFDYFLIGLSLPNEKFWVNLRPDAPEQIIDDELARTDLGKVMLEADLQLKKDTAGFTSPNNSQGKEYWARLYRKAGEIFGNENVSVPAITRPWIVPGEIIIMASGSSVYIYKASLKVMLEQDYLKDSQTYNFSDPRQKELNEYSSRLIRELIIPQLTMQVNTSKKYARLRQVFFSLILSRWFKETFKGRSGKYSSLIDTGKLDDLTSKENWSRIRYFDQYKKSFEDGEYNLKETVSTPYGAAIRSYVSGGEKLDFSLNAGPGSPAKVIYGRFDNNAIRAIMNHPGMSVFSSSPFVGDSSSALAKYRFPDADITFNMALGRSKLTDALSAPNVGLSGEYSRQGEEKAFPARNPDGKAGSHMRFGYKDSENGALRDAKIEEWAIKARKNGAKVLLHFGIGGQGKSNGDQADYWGERKDNRVIVFDRLGVSMKEEFRRLIKEEGYKIGEIILSVSSKSGSTDEPLAIYQAALNELIWHIAKERGFSDKSADKLVEKFIAFLKGFNKGREKDALFRGMAINEFNTGLSAGERNILRQALEQQVITTSNDARESRLFAFVQGLNNALALDIPVFDFSEYTGGRFTSNSESCLVTQAFQGLPIAEARQALKKQAGYYLGKDGNDPGINSALRAAILARKIDPPAIVVAVRSSNARSEAEQKEQLFPESNGKDGQGSWVVAAVGNQELNRKVRDIKRQTGRAPLVIIVDFNERLGFRPLRLNSDLAEDTPVIVYKKDDISYLANAKFTLWFQEFTVRYGLLSSADLALEKNINLKIPQVGASGMNKPIINGEPNYYWFRDSQNQPGVQVAKDLMVEAAGSLLAAVETSEDARINRYKELEGRIKNAEYISNGEINIARDDGSRNLSLEELKKFGLWNIEETKEALPLGETRKLFYEEKLKENIISALERIRYLKQGNKTIAPDLLRASWAKYTQERIEGNDVEIADLYEQIRAWIGQLPHNPRFENSARKLANLQVIAYQRRKIFSPVFYTHHENADILGEFISGIDYGIGTRDQHANFQHRIDGKDAVFNLLVDFVASYEDILKSQPKIQAFGLANNYLDGLYPDELRRLFLEKEHDVLSGLKGMEAIDYNGKAMEKKAYRDSAILRLPDISTNDGLIEALGVFYRAQELFDDRLQLLGDAMMPSASPIEFADLAQKAFESGFLSSRRALDNILSWQGPEYSAVHKQLNDEFKRAGTDEEGWREINDAWYRHVAVGTAGLRGKMGPGTNRINKYTLGRFMAAHVQAVISREYLDMLQKKGVFDPEAEKTAVVIGGDSRHGSWDPNTQGPGEFIKLEALINLALGVKRVYVFKGPTTTPQLAWSLANLDVDSGYRLISGSMSTASHNPREYNGNKVYRYDGSQATGEFAELIDSRLGSQTAAGLVNLEYRGLKILDNIDAAFKSAVENHDIRFLGRAFEGDREDGYRADELFIDRELRQGLYLSKDGRFQSEKIGYEEMKVVVSCLGGGARRNLKDMLEKRGFRPSQIIWVESEPDPDFKEIQEGKPNPELPQTRATALRKAVEVDADMVVWLDPDADRPAAAVKKKILRTARSEDDYLSLNGNQQLAVLAEYLIRELKNIAKEGNYKGASYLAKRAGELVGNLSRVTMATTHVSGDLMKVIARSGDINVIETLTGFKYIGGQIERRNENARRAAGVSYSQWRRLLPEEKIDLFLKYGQEVFIMGGEDSLGIITDVDLHDKDALSGVSWLMEIYGRLKNSGVYFDEYLDRVYQTYGYFAEAFPMLTKGNVYGGVVFPEEKAMQIIKGEGKSLLEFFRDRLPLRIVGKKVIAVLDFERQKAYKQDMTSLFDGDYSGLVTPEAQDLLTYSGFNELKGIPLPMPMLKSENAAALRGVSSFRHRPIGDETGLGEPLPAENFVMVLLEDGSKVIIRPSNTESIVKFYINARGLYEGREETDEWIKDAYSELDSLSDSIARELFPESFEAKSSSSLGDTGGIDFSGDMNILSRNIPGTPIRERMNPARLTALNINMDKELSGLQNMLKGRIMPSLEKLGDDIIYCRKKGSFDIYKEGIILSLVDIGRLGEDHGLDMGQPYTEAIFLAHSANPLLYPIAYEDSINED